MKNVSLILCDKSVVTMQIRTRLTSLLGIKHPIVLPGMSWISTPVLVAAVSNAGGLGILATGPLTEAQTRESIREIRRLTDKPFGIGCTLLMPGAKENAMVALEEKVPVINISLGKGDWIVKQAHAYGGKVIATVVNEKHAKSAEAMGCDALMVTGHEAAAHGGDVTSLVLVPALATKVPNLPIICAGGIADGRGLAAMLALGADGVAMGSRLATTVESPLAEPVKHLVVSKTENDTIYGTNFDGLGARIMLTDAAKEAMKKPLNPVVAAFKAFSAAKLIKMPMWKVIPGLLTHWKQMYQLSLFGAATEKLMKATIEGNTQEGIQFIGQSQGLINDIAPVEVIIQRCVKEAIAIQSERIAPMIVHEKVAVSKQ
jgi:enoyl-[acyl-carrier protein] reductase II